MTAQPTVDRWLRITKPSGPTGVTTTASPIEQVDPCEVVRSLKAGDREAVIDRITSAGVVADRVLCPDLPAQFSTTAPVDTVVVNILDSDPHAPFQTVVARDFGPALLAGLAAVSRAFATKRTIAVIDADAPPDLLALVRQACRQFDVQFVRLSNPYPQAHPTLLLHTLLQRKLKPGSLPTEVGVILLDAPAAVAVGHAVWMRRSMDAVPVAMHDHRRDQVRYAMADVGTTVRQAVESLQIDLADAVIRAGDLLRDQVVSPDYAIGTGELMFHLTASAHRQIPDPCIRCGWCMEVCPTRIHPAGLLDAAQGNDRAMARRFGVDACIECGMCTYACPSRLPLLGAIRTLL